VPDPYYDADEGFERVFQMLDDACARFVARHSPA
jgi:protein-tyrosine-phosphatase